MGRLAPLYPLDDARWRAVEGRDRAYEGAFLVCVATTGIFCHPWCPSRTPKRENVSSAATRREAELAGYRACKRCRP